MKVTAKDLMSPEVITISSATTVEEALKVIVGHKVTGLPVVNAAGELVGILSEYDLLKQISSGKKKNPDVFGEKIKFSDQIEAIGESALLAEVVQKFVKLRYRRLPVLNKKQKLVGIITRRDLMKAYFYQVKLP